MASSLPSDHEFAENALDVLLADSDIPKAVYLKVKLLISKNASQHSIEQVFEKGISVGLTSQDIDMYDSHYYVMADS